MRTPIVLRPCEETSSAWMRMTLPLVVTSRMSSPSRTCSMPTTVPLRPAVLMSMIPFPARPWSRYSSSGVRLPKPRSVTVRICAPSCTTSAAMTASPSSTSMPRTPAAPRPMGRTSSSLKRIAMPSLVAIITSRWPSVRRAVMTSSPSSRPTAWIPPARGCEYASSSVFLILPWRVTKRTYPPAPKSRTGTQVATCSPSPSERRFTIALPLAARPPSGISCTLSQWVLPRLVKNRR